MNRQELAKRLAKALLLKEGGGRLDSCSSLMCLRSYFSEMSFEELLGVATQNGITEPLLR